MAILVTGGAGYIGSATVETLRAEGQEVVVLDNLFRGHRKAVDESVVFYQGEISDSALVEKICRDHQVTACVHFAALAYVGESVSDPEMYWHNNVSGSVGLFDGLVAAGVKNVVFSSTCATYGEPQYIPLDEKHPQKPESPYGWTKFTVERVLETYDTAHGLKFVALRYFNACGALENRGEDHTPESHLIPLVLFVAQGKRSHISVFGTDYPTPDGTAIRDYIHIADLASAHVLSLKYLQDGGESNYFNLGNGSGYSVLEVIETAKKVTGCDIKTIMEPRRAGDPSRLIGSTEKAQSVLGWKQQYADLETIVRTAWNWHQSHPDGYGN